jgi:hypothetical protein
VAAVGSVKKTFVGAHENGHEAPISVIGPTANVSTSRIARERLAEAHF